MPELRSIMSKMNVELETFKIRARYLDIKLKARDCATDCNSCVREREQPIQAGELIIHVKDVKDGKLFKLATLTPTSEQLDDLITALMYVRDRARQVFEQQNQLNGFDR